MGIPFNDVKVYRKPGRESFDVENAKLRESLAGLVEGSVSVEMVPPDYRTLRITIPEVCLVDDFLWPSWREKTKT